VDPDISVEKQVLEIMRNMATVLPVFFFFSEFIFSRCTHTFIDYGGIDEEDGYDRMDNDSACSLRDSARSAEEVCHGEARALQR
jgi:hypothetical protein